VSVNLTGFADLQRRLERLSKEEATKAGQAANRAGAVVVRKAAIQEAPDSPKTTEGEVRTRHNKGGSTRREVHHKIKNWIKVKKTRSTSATEVQNTVAIFAYQSLFVQFGSIHNAADPFFQRAVDNNKQSIIEAMAKVLNRQLVRRGV